MDFGFKALFTFQIHEERNQTSRTIGEVSVVHLISIGIGKIVGLSFDISVYFQLYVILY